MAANCCPRQAGGSTAPRTAISDISVIASNRDLPTTEPDLEVRLGLMFLSFCCRGPMATGMIVFYYENDGEDCSEWTAGIMPFAGRTPGYSSGFEHPPRLL